jgi:hypothetical protein
LKDPTHFQFFRAPLETHKVDPKDFVISNFMEESTAARTRLAIDGIVGDKVFVVVRLVDTVGQVVGLRIEGVGEVLPDVR